MALGRKEGGFIWTEGEEALITYTDRLQFRSLARTHALTHTHTHTHTRTQTHTHSHTHTHTHALTHTHTHSSLFAWVSQELFQKKTFKLKTTLHQNLT